MKAKPSVTPHKCGRPRRKPKLSPEVINMVLLGPGVNKVTTTNVSSAHCSSDPTCAAPSHRSGTAGDGRDARARDLDQAEPRHDGDELLDLGAAARDLEYEMLRGGIDHVGAEYLGEA